MNQLTEGATRWTRSCPRTGGVLHANRRLRNDRCSNKSKVGDRSASLTATYLRQAHVS